MRGTYITMALTVAGTLVVITSVAGTEGPPAHAEPPPAFVGASEGGTAGSFVLRSDACPAENLGVLESGGSWIRISGSTVGSTNQFENDGDDCNYGLEGRDEIFQFEVDATGIWHFNTRNICAGWNTSLMIREDTGGGCPGDWLACDGDSGHSVCGNYESVLQTCLRSGTTYYLIVDGYEEDAWGTFDVTVFLAVLACTEDTDCVDSRWCNGDEWCDTSEDCPSCQPGTRACLSHQACDEDLHTCADPDPCVSWLGGYPYAFYPVYKLTPGGWALDDIELQGHTSLELNHYEVELRGVGGIWDPVGTEYYVDTALFTVEEDTCLPKMVIPGTECIKGPFYLPSGMSPPMSLRCDPGIAVLLPDNSGDSGHCEIDFFLGFRTACVSVGFGVAGEGQVVGGPAADDEFGFSLVYAEDAPMSGTFHTIPFSGVPGFFGDFGNALVCTVPIGVCCVSDHPWDCLEEMTEEDCAALGGIWTANNFWAPVDCDDPDGDDIPTPCGDNCPDVANADQADCDGGVTPEGDACESDSDYTDDDRDGECNGTDGCPNDANKIEPGICGCHTSDVDSDGDGVPDCHDGCPHDSNKIDPGQCGCGLPEDDTDGDGVADCIDQCPEVDDAIFAPRCVEAIPTVSLWGLVILALLLLVAGKIYFGGRRCRPASP